jgi:hypothetical protein
MTCRINVAHGTAFSSRLHPAITVSYIHVCGAAVGRDMRRLAKRYSKRSELQILIEQTKRGGPDLPSQHMGQFFRMIGARAGERNGKRSYRGNFAPGSGRPEYTVRWKAPSGAVFILAAARQRLKDLCMKPQAGRRPYGQRAPCVTSGAGYAARGIGRGITSAYDWTANLSVSRETE